jgi:hypothetical protein
MYELDYPQAVNYGNQGSTAGHELTHGYDDEGVQFFLNGVLDRYIDAQSAQVRAQVFFLYLRMTLKPVSVGLRVDGTMCNRTIQ